MSTRYGVYGRTGCRALLAVTTSLGMLVALVVPASAATQQVTQLKVSSTQSFTDSGVALRSGQLVTIAASGSIHFGGGRVAAMAPVGIPWGSACTAIAGAQNPSVQNPSAPWPAPGLSCWSLIGRVGFGPPFEIGAKSSFRVAESGELFLGVNDTFLGDNYGKWAATVTVTPHPTVATTTKRAKRTSKTKTFVLIGVLLVGVLLLGGIVWSLLTRRRRVPPLPVPEPVDVRELTAGEPFPIWPPVEAVPVLRRAVARDVEPPGRAADAPSALSPKAPSTKSPMPKMQPATKSPKITAPSSKAPKTTASPAKAPKLPGVRSGKPAKPEAPVDEPAHATAGTVTSASAAASPAAPATADPGDGAPREASIFSVEFWNGLTLRVGYSNFPKGSVLQWRVTQDRAVAATGYFMTQGGVDIDHVESVPLGMQLEGPDRQPDGVDVRFDWTVHGVPQSYTVRRDPNC